jgi:hypothetical protein
MSSDFTIITGEKKKAEPEDNSPAKLVEKWFSSVKNVSPKTIVKIKELVRHKLEAGACRHLLPKLPPQYQLGSELQCCVEQVITEQWNILTPEERLLIRFPSVQNVGEKFEIPKRGTGTIIRRELTPRFGIEMVFQLEDGSFFKWEFID